MENVKKEEVIKVREDLNKMVSQIKFEEVGTKNYPRKACVVTLWSGKKIEFSDRDDLFELFVSYQASGKKDFIKNVSLVEEEKRGESLDFGTEEDFDAKTYFCVKYELTNGKIHRLFPAKKFARDIIINYYDAFKKLQAEQKSTAPNAQNIGGK